MLIVLKHDFGPKGRFDYSKTFYLDHEKIEIRITKGLHEGTVFYINICNFPNDVFIFNHDECLIIVIFDYENERKFTNDFFPFFFEATPLLRFLNEDDHRCYRLMCNAAFDNAGDSSSSGGGKCQFILYSTS